MLKQYYTNHPGALFPAIENVSYRFLLAERIYISKLNECIKEVQNGE
jgi:hypothetical protein